ncbi:MAG: hypothetical protein N2042_06830 [Thermodesulfovibrio sp.]|nr:hypothetical protein [Thermodesulfovibrio sp.]
MDNLNMYNLNKLILNILKAPSVDNIEDFYYIRSVEVPLCNNQHIAWRADWDNHLDLPDYIDID